jgi:hypothetical protein
VENRKSKIAKIAKIENKGNLVKSTLNHWQKLNLLASEAKNRCPLL